MQSHSLIESSEISVRKRSAGGVVHGARRVTEARCPGSSGGRCVVRGIALRLDDPALQYLSPCALVTFVPFVTTWSAQ